VRKEISAERTHQDTFVVQKTYYGRYTGGFFLYRVGQDTFVVPKVCVGRSSLYGFSTPQDTAGAVVFGYVYNGYYLFRIEQDTFGIQSKFTGVYMGPQDTAGIQFIGKRVVGYYLYHLQQDTFKTVYGRYAGRFYLYGTPQDTAGAGVDRTRYTGGFFLYRVGQDTFGVQYLKPRYTGGFFLYRVGQDTVPPITSPPTTSALVPPTYTVWTTQPIGYPVEGGIVLGEFTPTYVGLPGPFPESISVNVRRGTQGEIVVTFTQLH
jgi:hypothetical protein